MSRRRNRTSSQAAAPSVVVVAALSLASVLPSSAAAAADATSSRLAGETRYGTAAEIAEYIHISEPVNSAKVASGADFGDALSSVNIELPRSPLLLTAGDALPQETRDAIRVGGVTRVDIIGGPAAVSAAVESELRALGVETHRHAGRNRYETSLATLRATYDFEGSRVEPVIDGKRTAFLASGERYSDGLAAAPIAAAEGIPLALTARSALPAATIEYFDVVGHDIEQVILLGGTDAISGAVEAQLVARGLTVRRLAGPTRQDTAIELARFANQHFPAWDLSHVNLTRGDRFPDALSVGPLGAYERAPTLLTESPTALGASTRAFLEQHAAQIDDLHVIGDETAVSGAVEAEAVAAAED